MELKDYHGYDEAQILPLYASVGWTNYTRNTAMLAQAYAGSLRAIAAWDGGRLVGIIRAVGDGASILYIQDLLVHPDYQRQGIGTQLLQAMLDSYPSVYQTVLLTDNTPKTLAFYRSMGFSDNTGCIAFLKVHR